MTSRRSILLTLILALAPVAAMAQLEHAIWYFGNRAGLDFRGGAPVATTNGFDYQWEGTSTICDRWTGQLLFHTDGDTVWNRQGQIMPNGTGLGGHLSSTQSALIVPFPEDTTRYYIISTDAGEYYGGESAVSWSIVDMKLDGGLGAVTQRKVRLFAPVAEKVAAVKHCNGRGYWIILHELRTDRFITYYLSKNGFEGPRFTSIGSTHGIALESGIGGMKFSQKGDRLAAALFSTGVVDLFDFDRKTGTLSNAISATGNPFAYDVCFSPDGTKLYLTGEQARYLVQFDATARDAATLEASRTEIFRSTHRWPAFEHIGGVQAGPDGRLYVVVRNEQQMSVITQPNRAGALCGYQHRTVLLGDHYGILGLPNFIYGVYDTTLETCRPPRARFSSTSRTICAGETVTFSDESYDNPLAWHWSFPGGVPSMFEGRAPGTVSYPSAGTYAAMLVVENANGSDTLVVDVTVNRRPIVSAGEDRTICIGADTQIGSTSDEAATYLWSPTTGLSCPTCPDPVASPTSTTTYTVVATSPEGCTSSDEVTVVVEPFPAVDAGRDTAICIGESVRLQGSGGSELLWTPATGLSCTTCADPIATPLVSTTYTLMTSNDGRCVSIDSVRVTVSERPTPDAGDPVQICQGESAHLEATGGARYVWTPPDDLSCSDCSSPVATPSETRTYYVEAFNASGCGAVDSVTVFVNPAPRLVHMGLGPDQGIFPGTQLDIPVVLEERLDAASVAVIDMAVDYDPTIMHLLHATLDSSLTEGWTAVVTGEDRARGRFAARLFATNGATLVGSGILARLRFQSFINVGDSSTARLTVALPGKECTQVLTRPVVVRLDSVCALSQRLLSATGAVYALEGNAPNPFNPSTRIDFSLGLDGNARVEILDAAGRTVAVLADGPMTAGRHALVWDASEQSSGVYFCRVTSGEWTRTIAMTLKK
jgi:PKD repeat protein